MDSPSTTNRDAERTVAQRICLGGAILAVVVLLAGVIWGRVAIQSPQLLWSPEQAAQYKAASDALHAAPHDHGNPSDEAHADESSPDDVAARERFNALQLQLDRAQYAQTRLGPLLTRIGLAGAIAFGIGYLVSRS